MTDWPDCDFIRDVEEDVPPIPLESLTGWEAVIFELEELVDYLLSP